MQRKVTFKCKVKSVKREGVVIGMGHGASVLKANDVLVSRDLLPPDYEPGTHGTVITCVMEIKTSARKG